MKNEINTEYGFWGTIAGRIDNDKEIAQVWTAMLCKVEQTNPKADTAYAYEFLNSRVGRHFADSLTDTAATITADYLIEKIIKLTTYSMAMWYEWFADRPATKSPRNMRAIYANAIRGAIMDDATKTKLTAALGDGWATIEHWLAACDEQELARACMDIIK